MSTEDRPEVAPAQQPPDPLTPPPLTPASLTPASLTPIPFGRYRLLRRIGAGGMAEIWRAVAVGEQGFERTVAIKRIREEVAQVADIGELFADEARLSALLDHPNIVQVYDFGAVDGTYYIAMEYLKGRNLDEVLLALRRSNQRIDPALAVFIAREVARGLAYAHTLHDDRGRPFHIIHRDVSPANVMLLTAGAVKLLDFGIARITSELRQAVTQGRALRGKCPYLAPEQITGGTVDGRSDLFALGVVLWEMLTGQRLFRGESDVDTIASVLNQHIPAPSSLQPEVPEALDRIVLMALARDPEQRYRSADGMAADLDEVMHALPCRHGDLPALIGRLFGPLPRERAPGETDPLQPPPRFALEVATPPGGGRVPVGPNEITRRELPLVQAAATAKASLPAAGPTTPSSSAEVITAVELRDRLLTGRGRPAVLPARTSRWSLMAVLGALVVTELVGGLLYHTFDQRRGRDPLPSAVAAVAAPLPQTARPCAPATTWVRSDAGRSAETPPLVSSSSNFCPLPTPPRDPGSATSRGAGERRMAPVRPARASGTRSRGRRTATRAAAAPAGRKAGSRTVARGGTLPRSTELHVDPFAE